MKRRRLLVTIPRVYVGPGAKPALAGERGMLLGAKRPRWVDVLALEVDRGSRIAELIERRFAPHPPWEVVGLSLSSTELLGWSDRLLRELVPGDVLLTERGPSVHRGDEWAEAKLLRG